MANESMMSLPNFSKTRFDPEKDLTPIAMITRSVSLLFVNPTVPARTYPAFVSYLKANTDKVNFAVIGNSLNYLDTLRWLQLVGVKPTTIPYSSNATITPALLANTVQAYLGTGAATIEQAKAGKLFILAVTSSEPLASVPEVPTMRSLGVDFESTGWWGVFAPKGIPKAVEARLSQAFADVARNPEIGRMLRGQGYDPNPMTGEEFRGVFLRAIANGNAAAKAAGIQPQ